MPSGRSPAAIPLDIPGEVERATCGVGPYRGVEVSHLVCAEAILEQRCYQVVWNSSPLDYRVAPAYLRINLHTGLRV